MQTAHGTGKSATSLSQENSPEIRRRLDEQFDAIQTASGRSVMQSQSSRINLAITSWVMLMVCFIFIHKPSYNVLVSVPKSEKGRFFINKKYLTEDCLPTTIAQPMSIEQQFGVWIEDKVSAAISEA